MVSPKPKEATSLSPVDTPSVKPKTSIHELKDELLDAIFSFLNFVQRARCESVCKRWHEIIRKSSQVCLPRENTPQFQKLDDTVLYSVLSRSGNTCKKLTLECNSKLTCQSVMEIGQLCPNLVYLDMAFKTRDQTECLVAMSPSCQMVKTLRIKNSNDGSRFCNDGLLAFVQNCRGLENLHVSNLMSLGSECLKAINPSLQSLSLHTSGLTSEAMQGMMGRCNRIREIKLDYCDVSDQTALFDFLQHFKETLKILRIRSLYFLPNVQWRDCLRHLPNLEVLELHRCGRVDDTLMDVVANKCPNLRSLDIGSSDVTDVGLIALQNLQNLRQLRVGDGVSYGLELLVSKGILEHVIILQRYSVFEDVYHNLAARHAKVRFTTEMAKETTERS